MANSVKDQITKSTEAAKARINKSNEMARKSFRAYVGLHTAAYERIVPMVKSATKNYDVLAEKGEAFENAAQSFANDTRTKVQKSYEDTLGKVRSALPRKANDRVEELESEIARLNRKITTLSKKTVKKTVKRAAKPATATTEASAAA